MPRPCCDQCASAYHIDEAHTEQDFLCTYSGCRRAVRGRGFNRESVRTKHMRSVHEHFDLDAAFSQLRGIVKKPGVYMSRVNILKLAIERLQGFEIVSGEVTRL